MKLMNDVIMKLSVVFVFCAVILESKLNISAIF